MLPVVLIRVWRFLTGPLVAQKGIASLKEATTNKIAVRAGKFSCLPGQQHWQRCIGPNHNSGTPSAPGNALFVSSVTLEGAPIQPQIPSFLGFSHVLPRRLLAIFCTVKLHPMVLPTAISRS